MSSPVRALVADDEPALAEYLRNRLTALWPELEILPIARNGLEALAAIRDQEPQLAFLDIRMPGMTGLELASHIDTLTHVVFVTAYDQYAVEAFERDAVDYIVKPVTDERLQRTIERLKKKLAGNEVPESLDSVLRRIAQAIPGTGGGYLKWVRVLKGEEVHQIAVDDVLYFQASDKYTCVITRGGESLIRLSLSELAQQLDPDIFRQIHRSTIVNMNYVALTRRDLGGRVFLKLRESKTELAVSRAHSAMFRQM